MSIFDKVKQDAALFKYGKDLGPIRGLPGVTVIARPANSDRCIEAMNDYRDQLFEEMADGDKMTPENLRTIRLLTFLDAGVVRIDMPGENERAHPDPVGFWKSQLMERQAEEATQKMPGGMVVPESCKAFVETLFDAWEKIGQYEPETAKSAGKPASARGSNGAGKGTGTKTTSTVETAPTKEDEQPAS